MWQSESEFESAAILKGIAEDMASPRQFQNSEKCTRPSVNLRCVAFDVMSAVIHNKSDFLMDVSHRVDFFIEYTDGRRNGFLMDVRHRIDRE